MSDEDLSDLWRTKYTKVPKKPDASWRENRQRFMENPEQAISEAASSGKSLDDLVRETNLPATVLTDAVANVPMQRGNRLFNELANVLESKEAHRNLTRSGRVKPLKEK
jgi:hypothetical protein